MDQTIKVQDNLREITSYLESEGYKRRIAFTNYPKSVRLDRQWFDITEKPGTKNYSKSNSKSYELLQILHNPRQSV